MLRVTSLVFTVRDFARMLSRDCNTRGVMTGKCFPMPVEESLVAVMEGNVAGGAIFGAMGGLFVVVAGGFAVAVAGGLVEAVAGVLAEAVAGVFAAGVLAAAAAGCFAGGGGLFLADSSSFSLFTRKGSL